MSWWNKRPGMSSDGHHQHHFAAGGTGSGAGTGDTHNYHHPASSSTTRKADQISDFFKSQRGYDSVYAPFGKPLPDQARWVLRNMAFTFTDETEPGVNSGRRGPPSSAAVASALKLFREDHDVPFIARYRGPATEHMSTVHLRVVQKGLAQCDACEKKRGTVYVNLMCLSSDVFNASTGDTLRKAVLGAGTVEELEELYAPFKDEKKPDKATVARKENLQPIARLMLEGGQDWEAKRKLDQIAQLSRYSGTKVGQDSCRRTGPVWKEKEELAVCLAADALFSAMGTDYDDPVWCVEYTSTYTPAAAKVGKSGNQTKNPGAKGGSSSKGHQRGTSGAGSSSRIAVIKANDKKAPSSSAASNKVCDPAFVANVEKYARYGEYAKSLKHVRGYQFLAIARAAEAKVVKSGFRWGANEARALGEICLSGHAEAVRSLVATTSSLGAGGAGGSSSSSAVEGPRLGTSRLGTSIRIEGTATTSASSSSAARDHLQATRPRPPNWFKITPECYLGQAVKKASTRLKQMLNRRYLRELKERAIEEAVAQFRLTLSQKLLTPPARLWLPNRRENNKDEEFIMALDPGFRQGTKLAVVNFATGAVAETRTLHFPRDEGVLADLLLSTSSEGAKSSYGGRIRILALGNGKGSQEVEKLLRDICTNKTKNLRRTTSHTAHHLPPESTPKMSFAFLVVDETGASVYSAADLAESELCDVELCHRSAVSLARRLIDPLAELCKVPPQSLGVGQYQHSVPEKQLTLEAVKCFEEAIANVGVDLNTCSAELLQYVPGIGKAKAAQIVKARDEQRPSNTTATSGASTSSSRGPRPPGTTAATTSTSSSSREILLNKNGLFAKKPFFQTKEDLKRLIKGLGEKSFQQASGFVYISGGEDVVDRTPHIHPEQVPVVRLLQKYEETRRKLGGADLPHLGSDLRAIDPHLKIAARPEAIAAQASYSKNIASRNAGCSWSATPAPSTRTDADVLDSILREVEEVTKKSKNTKKTEEVQMDRKAVFDLISQLVPSARGGLAGTDSREKEPAPTTRSLTSTTSSNNKNPHPLPRKNAADVVQGERFEGVVRNVTEFAAYVDIGVGADAFLHVSKFAGRTLQVNEVLPVVVNNNEWKGGKQRINVSLL